MKAFAVLLVLGLAIQSGTASRKLLQASPEPSVEDSEYTGYSDYESSANINSLYDVLSTTPGLETLKAIVDGLVENNNTFAPLVSDLFNNTAANGTTLFAPSNKAFAELLTGLEAFNATGVLSNDSVVVAILITHVVPFAVPSANLTNNLTLPTLVGVNLTVSINGTNITIISPGSKALVVAADLGDNDNVVHVVDHVLLPATLEGLVALFGNGTTNSTTNSTTNATSLYDELQASGNFTILLSAIDMVSDAAKTNANLTNFRAALSNTTLNITLFAPTDEALASFANMNLSTEEVNAVLAAHVVLGSIPPPLQAGEAFTSLANLLTQVVSTSTGLAVTNKFSTPAALTGKALQAAGSTAYPIEGVLLPSASA